MKIITGRLYFFAATYAFLTMVSGAVAANSGQSLYQQCIGCHAQKAQGNAQLEAPALAGQLDWYLERQLTNFASGVRGSHSDDLLGQQMQGIAKTLDGTNDIAALSQYLSQQPPVNVLSSVSGDLKKGAGYYHAKCGACHGGRAQGNMALNAPKLSLLSASYLKRQMAHFNEGVRGTRKADKYGRQMAMIAKTVSTKELNDIVLYITKQQ